MVDELCAKPVEITKLPLALPAAIAPGQVSFFVVGLHKAGSTLLAESFRRVAAGYNYVPYDLHQAIYNLGLPVQDVAIAPGEFFRQFGYAFIGFRGWSATHSLPSWSQQRIVHLVRDPRDVLVSMYYSIAKSHIAPSRASEHSAKLSKRFVEDRKTALALGVDDFALAWADTVYKEYTDTFDVLGPAAPRIWRYEDVIFNKVAWVRDMLRYLGMEPPPDDVLIEIIRPFDIFPSSENAERHIRQVRPGDHKAKLAKATIDQLSERFAPVLRRYGYS